MWNRGQKWGYLHENAFDSVQLPSKNTRPWHHLIPKEFKKLISVAPDARWRAIYCVLYGCGLRFGEVFDDRMGWETDPGEVVLRYGVPRAEAQNTTRFDRYFIFHYGDIWFKFMDLAKSEKPTFY